ncbi:MAG: FCD domain-containing protein [Pseudomonadota bacterium]
MTDAAAPASKHPSKRAADKLFETFADMINSGVLVDGQPLPPEREIVSTYGVSRTVVREAVLALANKGLVEARPRFRPIVRKPSYDTAFETIESVVGRLLKQPGGVRNLFDTRIMIEAGLVRQAAVEAQKDDIKALERALASNGEAVDDSEQFYRTDIAFHEVLYHIPKNPVLPAVHKAYTAWLGPHWSRMPRAPDRNRHNHAAHTAIFRTILRRDADAAEAALRVHLDDAWAQVRATFGEI